MGIDERDGKILVFEKWNEDGFNYTAEEAAIGGR
jgi:hypothetical protein